MLEFTIGIVALIFIVIILSVATMAFLTIHDIYTDYRNSKKKGDKK